MNDLRTYLTNNAGRLIDKWDHYFEIYDRHLSRFRNTHLHVVEIGVYQGGSLQMWKEYFGPRSRLFGVDINPACKQLEEEQIEVIIGDQSDRRFLRSLPQRVPKIDVLIDDGGHRMEQQIRTFEELFPCIDENGVYVCEDLHTSYWRGWGGGYKRRGTFIEYSKDFIDRLHAWHSREPQKLGVTDFTKSVHSLHYYDSILVIEKHPRERPFCSRTGVTVIPDFRPPKPPLQRLRARGKRALKRLLGLS